jgi:hypothetical protein
MESADERLAVIGYGKRRDEPPCWRAVRLDVPRPAFDDPADPANSRALLWWRKALARDPRPSPYRISRAFG